MSTRAILVPTVEALLGLLESEDFYCDVAVASSAQSFYRRLLNHSLTEQLVSAVYANPACAEVVLSYASRLAKSSQGAVRSENDAALCACLVALGRTAVPGVDDLLLYLKNSKELALRWASEIADIVSDARVSTVRTVISFAGRQDYATPEGHRVGVTRNPTVVSDYAVSLV